MLIRIIRDNTKAGRMPAENRIHLRIRMKNCRINLQDYKGKPLKTRTVLADRQRTEGQDNMPFAVYSFDRIILFKEGRIVGQGTFEELLHTDSYFMDLYNANVK